MRYHYSLLFILFSLFINTTPAFSQRFAASDAAYTKGMILKLESEGQTLHKWNSHEQTISWNANLEAGRYEVMMRYSQPYQGCAVRAEVDGREVVAMLQPTPRWGDYRSGSLGIITVARKGTYTILLQGTQNALRSPKSEEIIEGKAGSREPKHEEAFPDLSFVELIPTDKPATDNACGIDASFKGKPLFDGKTFEGWEGNNGKSSEKWFRIEDGAIVAGSLTESVPQNEFLRTKRKYSDFELRLKFRIVDPDKRGWNGGIQFRSVQHPDKPYEMFGYQADIYARRWGGIYDESRRSTFLGTILSEQECHYEQWNEYILRCEGPRIRLWLNGKPVIDYIEPFAFCKHPDYGIIPNKGYIALQIHERKNPYEVWYKDIQLQELKVPAAITEHYTTSMVSECKASGLLAPGTPLADSLGWKTGIQAYDFKRVATFFDAIRLTAALGLHHIEGVGMTLSKESNVSFGPDMPDDWKARLRQELINNNVTLTSYYRRVNGQQDPKGTERVFQFCKEFGITLVTDPIRVAKGNGSMDYYEALAEKYGVQVVLTNHPESDGSPYYDPDTVLEDLKGRSPLLGASVDMGHFMRDGRDPLPIVQKYIAAGRMYHFHFRDVSGFGKSAYDVPVGKGAGNVTAIFRMLRDTSLKPIMALEYERDMYNPLLDIIPSVYGIEECLRSR